MISSTVPVYIAESSPLRLRGKLVSSHVTLITLGQFIASGVAGLFSRAPRTGWRLVDCATLHHVDSPFCLVFLHGSVLAREFIYFCLVVSTWVLVQCNFEHSSSISYEYKLVAVDISNFCMLQLKLLVVHNDH
jgi:hypothetical protein